MFVFLSEFILKYNQMQNNVWWCSEGQRYLSSVCKFSNVLCVSHELSLSLLHEFCVGRLSRSKACTWCAEKGLSLNFIFPARNSQKEFCSSACLAEFRKAYNKVRQLYSSLSLSKVFFFFNILPLIFSFDCRAHVYIVML